MRNAAWFGMAVVAVTGVLMLACEHTTPAPEVEVTFFNPLGVYVDPTLEYAGPNDVVNFMCYNYVDAVVKTVSYEVYNRTTDALIFEERPLLEMSLFVSGDGQTVAELLNLLAPVADVCSLMYADEIRATYLRFIFTGEDAFGYEKEFTTEIDFGLTRLDL